MTFSSIFSLVFLLSTCTLFQDPEPANKDAPELEFSKPQWVNEFQYDGVFTLNKDAYDNFGAQYQFYGAEAKAISFRNSKYDIKNGFWFSPEISNYFNPNFAFMSSLKSDIYLNDVSLANKNTFNGRISLGKIMTNNIWKYNAEKGLKWEVRQVFFPFDETWKAKNKLSDKDSESFKMIKEGISVFPTPIKLEDTYRLTGRDLELKIAFEPSKDADLVYVKFSFDGYSFDHDLGQLQANGFLKYYTNDQNSITLKRAEFDLLLKGRKEVTMTVIPVKFYSAKNETRKFLFKNTAESKARIIIE